MPESREAVTSVQIEIYGASDDLIEIDGGIREEFSPGRDDEALLAFSDGTVLRIAYTNDGLWRISPITHGTATYSIVQATDVDDDYTDRAVLAGDIKWVVLGSQVAMSK